MLDETQIKAILNAELDSAIGYMDGELNEDRADAMSYYLGEAEGKLLPPAGEDRSHVVDSTVRDVIEWILPQLLKTFTQSSDYVRFDPVGMEDEEAAEQESDYVNYILTKQNDGFLIFYSMFKDALLQKTGISKVIWDKTEKVMREEYSALTDMELAQLLSDDEVEPEEHEARAEIVQTPMGAVEETVHDVVVKRIRRDGKCCVLPVPPEEFLVCADHNSPIVRDARFVAHYTEKTRSELVQMGFDKKVVWNLPSYDQDPDEEDRDSISDEQNEDNSVDKALQKIQLYDIYMLMDQDEDGIAERRHILYVRDSEILENEECDGVPFACLTPFIQTHRFIGQSIYDKVKEIQEQKTFIWRQLLDNLAFQNNQRYEVEVGKVNLEDMLTNRPGGVVRSKQIGSVVPLVSPPIGAAGYQMLEYLDKTRMERSGVDPNMAAQNISLSNDTAHGLERMMSAKEELVGLIARVFGETGIKQLFLLIRESLMKHQDKETVVKLRGKWVQINPADWRERTEMTLKVGLGTGDRLKQAGTLQAIMQRQDMLMQTPYGQFLLTPQAVYQAQIDFAEAGGLADGEQYFQNPGDARLPPPIDPAMVQGMQQQMQLMGQQLQQAQVLLANKEREHQIAAQKLQLDAQKAMSDANAKASETAQKTQQSEKERTADILRFNREKQQEAAEKAADVAIKNRELDIKQKDVELKYGEQLMSDAVFGQMRDQMVNMAELIQQMSGKLVSQAEDAERRRQMIANYVQTSESPRLKKLFSQIG